MNRIATTLAPIALIATLAFTVQDAQSGDHPGLAFKATFAADAGCLSRYTGWGDLRNNCAYPVDVSAVLAVPSDAWSPTKVYLVGNASWCRSVTINAVGNGLQVGPQVWTTGGPKVWQSLNLGDRYVWGNTSLVFNCGLEPGGVIGEYGTTI